MSILPIHSTIRSAGNPFGATTAVLLTLAGLLGCLDSETGSIDIPIAATSTRDLATPADINPRLLKRFRALDTPFTPDGSMPNAAKVTLGKRLFQETALSSDHTISCESCHDLQHFGVDGRSVSIGVGAQHGKRNAPSVYNAAGQFLQFWDGRAETVESQALGPLLNPKEMGLTDGAAAIAALRNDPTYLPQFQAAFPADADAMSFENVGMAIGAFERTLVTPSRWDKFLAGNHDALTRPEKEGLKTFLNAGCMVCHTGALVGGGMFERVGVVASWPDQSDQGRWEVTHEDGDRMTFKVPSLRNVERTAPYFHDGSSPELGDAVRKMGRYQLGLDLTSEEVDSITIWLKTLTGEPTIGATVTLPGAAPLVVVPNAVKSPALSQSAPCAKGSTCQLQAWMRGNAAPAIVSGDMLRLENMFNRLGSLAPAGFDQWPSLAERGAAAARAGNLDGCRAACASCHEAYAERYRGSEREKESPSINR